mgnify:CR=1 FL=1
MCVSSPQSNRLDTDSSAAVRLFASAIWPPRGSVTCASNTGGDTHDDATDGVGPADDSWLFDIALDDLRDALTALLPEKQTPARPRLLVGAYLLDLLGLKGPSPFPGRSLGDHPDKGGAVLVKNGRYGPYVAHDGINATLPSDKTPETITLEEAVVLLASAHVPLSASVTVTVWPDTGDSVTVKVARPAASFITTSSMLTLMGSG